MDLPTERDVIVVGAGNAATCAALSARENGASVLQLEISPEGARGGNSAFTGGAFRVVYHGFDDLARLIPDISDNELANVDVGTYNEGQYYDDVGRLTEYRSDPDLTEILITKSFETGVWMREKGGASSSGSAARRSRWTANSSSGAGSLATSGAAARN
ncbi:MAG: FAD-dependent oxidoreductase [Thiohalocapsa sp.]